MAADPVPLRYDLRFQSDCDHTPADQCWDHLLRDCAGCPAFEGLRRRTEGAPSEGKETARG